MFYFFLLFLYPFLFFKLQNFGFLFFTFCSVSQFFQTWSSLIIFAMSFVSNTINLVAIRFGCSQDSGSWAMFTFYLLGFTGTLIYDYFFLKLKRNRFFLLLYTSIGLANKLLNDHPCLYQHFHGSLPPIFCMLCLIRIFPYEQAAPGL